MNTDLANNLANANGIAILMKLFTTTKQQIYITLIQHILAFVQANKFIDVNNLFRLS